MDGYPTYQELTTRKLLFSFVAGCSTTLYWHFGAVAPGEVVPLTSRAGRGAIPEAQNGSREAGRSARVFWGEPKTLESGRPLILSESDYSLILNPNVSNLVAVQDSLRHLDSLESLAHR